MCSTVTEKFLQVLQVVFDLHWGCFSRKRDMCRNDVDWKLLNPLTAVTAQNELC